MQADTLKASFNGIDDLKAALDERAIAAITGPQGGFNCTFDTFCPISNYSRNELPGRKHRIFHPGHRPNEFFRSWWNIIPRGRNQDGGITNQTRDNQYYRMDTTIAPFKPPLFISPSKQKTKKTKNDCNERS